MPTKAKRAPGTIAEKVEAARVKLARLKADLIAIQQDATAAGFAMEPVALLMGRLAKPRLPRPVFRHPGQLEFAFMAATACLRNLAMELTNRPEIL